MANDKYYLLEYYSSKIDISNGEIIVLTPQASFKLDRLGIKYKQIDDFYSEEDLRRNAETYFFEQREWFKEFDNFLKENIEFCAREDIDLATAHYNQLKYFIDTTVFAVRILRSFIEKAKPHRIIYVSAYPLQKIDYSIYGLFHAKIIIFSQVLPHLCKYFNIPFEFLTENHKNAATAKRHLFYFKQKIKPILIKFRFKSVVSFIKFKKYLKIFNLHKPKSDLNILFLHAGCPSIDYAIIQSLLHSATVYTMSSSYVLKENNFLQKIAIDFDKNGDGNLFSKTKGNCVKITESLSKQKSLFSWINAQCSIDISAFLIPYLNYFILNFCPNDVVKIKKLMDFYNDKKIDLVVMRSSSGRDCAFSLAAAKKAKKTRTVCLQHSCTVRLGLLYRLTELGFVHYYVAREGFSEEYFKQPSKLDNFNRCIVLQSPHYFKLLQNKYKNSASNNNFSRESVIFVPTDAPFGTFNFNNHYYVGIWYYKFLISLLDYFSKDRTKIFIFKYPIRSQWMADTFSPYIKENGYDNILMENKPLVDCFNLGDRVILDYPSTGLFESVAIGKPTLSLYKSNLKIWPQAYKIFGNLIQPFSNSEEAIERIDNFLKDSREKYIANMPMREVQIVHLFDQIKNNNFTIS